MRIYEIVNRGIGEYGLGGDPLAPIDLLLIENDSSGGSSSTPVTINTSNGIIGGGDLSIDRTFELTGQPLALYNLATNGIIIRSALDTIITRSIVAGTGIEVVHGNGITGNPGIFLTGQALSFHALSDVGLVFRTSGIVGARTITAGDGVSITNGDGVSGNPIVSILANTFEVINNITIDSQFGGGSYTFTNVSSVVTITPSFKILNMRLTGINSTGTPSGPLRINFDPDWSIAQNLPFLKLMKGSSLTNPGNYIPYSPNPALISFSNIEDGSVASGVTFVNGEIVLSIII